MSGTRATALGWCAAAVLGAAGLLVTTGPVRALAGGVVGLALPVAAGRTSALVTRRGTTAALAAAIAATAIAILAALVPQAGSWVPVTWLGAAVGYWWERRRVERAVEPAAGAREGDTEIRRARMVRRLVVGAAVASFTGYCMLRAAPDGPADVKAEWFIRAVLGGVWAAAALLGALLARLASARAQREGRSAPAA